jgi:hypothetical protein
MGAAVWEFMWCLDKITKIDDQGVGWILGGKPVNLKDIAGQFLTSEVTTSRNLSKLAEEGYLTIIHAPYGLKIGVSKAKKRFNKDVNPQSYQHPLWKEKRGLAIKYVGFNRSDNGNIR